MKVVLFVGGLGTRLRDYSDAVPKPMVNIGNRPILWHLMKYFAFFGYTDFILCLGYKAETVKDYFLNYSEAVSNDFILSDGGRTVRLLSSDIDDWRISFVDTGMNASIGERLKAIENHLDGDDMFLANYSDGLTDLWLPDYIDAFRAKGTVGSFLAVHSTQSFHVAQIEDDDLVSSIHPLSASGLWVNAGFFAFRKDIFDYLGQGEDLVDEPFERLIDNRELMAHRYEGFWMAMDTFKDKQALDVLYESGRAPWELWRDSNSLRSEE